MSDIADTIRAYLDLSGDNKKDRLEKIDDLIHLLSFEKRLTSLTEDEAFHMMNADNGNSDEITRYRILHCKTDKDQEEVINDIARRRYFIQCAWSDYLNGISDFKPYDSKREAERTLDLLKRDYNESR